MFSIIAILGTLELVNINGYSSVITHLVA